MDLEYQAMKIKQEVEEFEDIYIANTEVLGIKIEASTSTNEIYNMPIRRITNEPIIEIVDPSQMILDTKKHIKVEENMLAVDVDVKNEEDESKTYMESATLQMRIEELYIKPDCDISYDKNSIAELERKSGEPSQLSKDTKKLMTVEEAEEDISAAYFKTEEQESEIDMNSSKLHVLTEEFDIKPDSVINDDENSSAALDRALKTKITGKEHEVFPRKADQESFSCYHCNFIVHSKKDLIHHSNSGNCSIKGSAKKKLIVRIRSHQSNEYICTKCQKIFKSKPSIDDHVIKKHIEFIASVSSKIHQCKHCKYKTTNATLLARHIMKHPESGCSVKQCFHCDKIFKCKIGLDDHVIKKHKDFIASVSSKIHKCKYCSYETTILNYLTKHIKTHPESGCGIKRFPCIHCDKTFKSKKALDNHVIQKHVEFMASVSHKILQCEYCNYKTIFSSNLANHMTKHPEKRCTIKEYLCIHCDASFKNKKSLDDHVIKNHKDFISSVSYKIHQCDHCSYKTTVWSSFTNHMTIHPENGCSVEPSSCIYCDSTFKSKKSLDKHVIKNHIECFASVSSIIHQCEHCSYKTTDATHMTGHMMRKHSKTKRHVKLYSCIHCDVTYKSKTGLEEHIIKKHIEFIDSVSSKIYGCEHCSFKSTFSSNLAIHMKKHPEIGSSVEVNPCIHCSKTFKSKKTLDDHVIRNHEEFIISVSSKIHQCKHCTYKTTIPHNITRHMVKHPETGCNAKLSPCIHCDKTFKSKKTLDDHVIRRHKYFISSVSSKIHQCKLCSYNTAFHYKLTSHMRKHPESGCNV